MLLSLLTTSFAPQLEEDEKLGSLAGSCLNLALARGKLLGVLKSVYRNSPTKRACMVPDDAKAMSGKPCSLN